MDGFNSQEDLRRVKFRSFFTKTMLLSNPAEHFPSPVKLHDQKYLLLGLESVLQANKEGMIGLILRHLPFSSRYLSFFVLSKLSLSTRSSLRIDLTA